MEQKTLDFNKVIVEFKGLVESMAFVALSKMRKPSPHSFEDLCQEGFIVCTEWVQRWFHPERGASLKTFITAGLRNHYADLVRASFKEKASPLPLGYIDNGDDYDRDEIVDPAVDRRNTEHDPIEMVSFNETLGRLTAAELGYITVVLTPVSTGKMPTRADVRRTLSLSEEDESRIRASIEEKLITQVTKS